MREQTASKPKGGSGKKTKTAMNTKGFRKSEYVEDNRDGQYYKRTRDELDKDLAKEFAKDKPKGKKK